MTTWKTLMLMVGIGKLHGEMRVIDKHMMKCYSYK